MDYTAQRQHAVESSGDASLPSDNAHSLHANQQIPPAFEPSASPPPLPDSQANGSRAGDNAMRSQAKNGGSADTRHTGTLTPSNAPDEMPEASAAMAQEFDGGVAHYYRVLELNRIATQDEVRSQYKRLVRLYHPDQFIDAQQKALAEERLKAINEAYRVISSRVVEGQLVRYAQQAMGLVVEPEMLDFGLLDRRQRRTAAFQVRFEKDVEGVDFIPSEEDGWFRVSKVSHVYGSQHASLEFEVEVDTTGLPAQTYQGWIDLYLDEAMTRLPLTVQVAAQPWHTLHVPRRWVLAATFVLAFVFFSTTMAFTKVGPFSVAADTDNAASNFFATDTFPLKRTALASPKSTSEEELAFPDTAPLYFALVDAQGQSAIYSTVLHENAMPQLVVDGTQASGLHHRHYVAYLAAQNGHPQVFLYNQSTGRTEQISSDLSAKSQLTWSADGAYLAYLVGEGEEARIGLYQMDTAHEYRLPGEVTAGVGNFVWSPDSQSLLFDLWRGTERRVYRMTVPDGELQQLTQFDSWVGSWSPDGSTIVVGAQSGLYRLDANGRQLRQISAETAERPLWSADGSWIAFLAQPIDGNSAERRLWLIRPDGSGASHVANEILWHAWSPEGATLAYVTGQRDAAEPLYYLWVSRPDGQSRLIAEVNSPYFSWGRE